MDRGQAFQYVCELLKIMLTQKSSDLFITANYPPAMKIDGKMTKVGPQNLSAAHTLALVKSVMTDKQIEEFESTKECNFAISPNGIGRFRVNAFVQQGSAGMVMRVIPTELPTIDGLGAPQILKEVVMSKRGLCILVGGTGSGKSTTLAAMVDYRNEHSFGHIITIEDPVEFVHPHKNCVVMQREVGIDTDNWEIALKNTLRQAPDVILMGEIRDAETMEHAMAFAETGHLCLATLHANSANQAIQRVINFFPQDVRHQVLQDLSLNLRAVVGQRLITNVNGQLVPALEVMVVTPYIADLISKGQIDDIKSAMAKAADQGMSTFDNSLYDLYTAGQITREQAIDYADSKTDVAVRIRLLNGIEAPELDTKY